MGKARQKCRNHRRPIATTIAVPESIPSSATERPRVVPETNITTDPTSPTVRRKRGRPKKLRRTPDKIDRDADRLNASLRSRGSNPKRPRRNVTPEKMHEALALLQQNPNTTVRQVA